MPKRPFRVPRNQPGGLTIESRGRRGRDEGSPWSVSQWVGHMSASAGGAKEVVVKISGGGRSIDGVQAHLEYIDRHGTLLLETDDGEQLKGKDAALSIVNEWGLSYGTTPGAPHSTRPLEGDRVSRREGPRQAFNIVLSMPPGTAPEKVLAAVKVFAREEFANHYRYAMALHAEDKDGHGKHPHVHLVVKAEHDYGGPRLNPRKADLHRWREAFARHMTEQGVLATATRRADRGQTKRTMPTAIYRATQRPWSGRLSSTDPVTSTRQDKESRDWYTEAGDSIFMRKKLEAIKREIQSGKGTVEDREAYRALLNVRAQVIQRYAEAVAWLRKEGREKEARRFELLQQQLPPVRTDRQRWAVVLQGSVRGDKARAPRERYREP